MSRSQVVSVRAFARNLAANWVGMGAEIAVGFFLTPYIVGGLGLVTYGLWSLLNSLVGYLGLVDLGIRGSVGRYVNFYLARNDATRLNEVIGTSLVFLSVAALMALGLSWPIAANFDRLFDKTPPELLPVLPIALPLLALNLWAAFLGSVFRTIIEAKDRFDLNNIVNVVVLIFRTVGTVWVLRSGGGLIGLAVVTLAASFIGNLMSWRIAHRVCREFSAARPTISRDRFFEMWRFGTASFVARSASQLIYQSDQIMVMFFFGPAAVGAYSIATMLIQTSRRLIEQIGGSLYPSIMKSGSIRDLDALRRIFVWYARLAFFVGILVYCGYIVFGREFLTLWIGQGVDAAWAVLAILSIGELLSLFGNVGLSVKFSLGAVRAPLLLSVGEAVTNIVLAIILVMMTPTGLLGIALGGCISIAIFRGGILAEVTIRHIDLSGTSYWRDIGMRAVVATATTMLLLHAIAAVDAQQSWLAFLSKIAVGSALYLGSCGLIMFKKEHVKGVVARIKRMRVVSSR